MVTFLNYTALIQLFKSDSDLLKIKVGLVNEKIKSNKKTLLHITPPGGPLCHLTGCPEKNAPQFLLNFSGYKHARKQGHNSLERWDP